MAAQVAVQEPPSRGRGDRTAPQLRRPSSRVAPQTEPPAAEEEPSDEVQQAAIATNQKAAVHLSEEPPTEVQQAAIATNQRLPWSPPRAPLAPQCIPSSGGPEAAVQQATATAAHAAAARGTSNYK